MSVGTTLGHFNNVAYEQRMASAALARQIAIQTGREVPEWELRPADWHLIWPELVGMEGTPEIAAAVVGASAGPTVLEASHAG